MHDRARLENKMHEKSCTKHDWIFSTISNPGHKGWKWTVQNTRPLSNYHLLSAFWTVHLGSDTSKIISNKNFWRKNPKQGFIERTGIFDHFPASTPKISSKIRFNSWCHDWTHCTCITARIVLVAIVLHSEHMTCFMRYHKGRIETIFFTQRMRIGRITHALDWRKS